MRLERVDIVLVVLEQFWLDSFAQTNLADGRDDFVRMRVFDIHPVMNFIHGFQGSIPHNVQRVDGFHGLADRSGAGMELRYHGGVIVQSTGYRANRPAAQTQHQM